MELSGTVQDLALSPIFTDSGMLLWSSDGAKLNV